MNHQLNERLNERLARAILAVKELDALGCVATRTEVSHLHPPVIHVVRVDAESIDLRSHVVIAMTIQGRAWVTYEAELEGCCVRWEEWVEPDRRKTAQAPALVGVA